MQIVPETLAHIRKSVVTHGFCDASDWARGLSELAELSDEQIDECCCDTWQDYWPKPLPVEHCIAQTGVSLEQALADRALYGSRR